MRENELRRLLGDGGRGINGWVAIPDPFSVEQYAAQGFDSVTVDLQHGAATLYLNTTPPQVVQVPPSTSTDSDLVLMMPS